MSDTENIAMRINEHEKEYLREIAETMSLQKRGRTEISYGKALKFLLEYCIHNDISPLKKSDDTLSNITKMIEHIHASMPHLMLHNQVQTKVLTGSLSDEDFSLIKGNAINYLNDNFGGYQSVSYTFMRSKINSFGIKTIPLEEGVSIWK